MLYDRLMKHTDAGVAVGDAVVGFDGVAVLAPRGRFEIELYGSFMKLLGQVGGGVQQHTCQFPAHAPMGLCMEQRAASNIPLDHAW